MDQNNKNIESKEVVQLSTDEKIRERNKSVLAYLHDIAYLLAGMLLIFLLLFRVVVVSGSSMFDTLVNGDYVLLLNNVFYAEPKQGDIIVASKSSFKDGEPIIKRVIATEGQTVTIKNGVVSVNGIVLDEVYLDEGTYTEGIRPSDQPIHVTVESGHVFCMGDNRGSSLDSRSDEIGQIDCREIVGKAVLLFLPRDSVDNSKFDFGRFGGLY